MQDGIYIRGGNMTEETRKKISNTLKFKGIKPPSNKGKTFSAEHVNKIIATKRENGSLKHTAERTSKIQGSRKKYYDGIGRTSNLRDLIEGTKKYKEWHKAVLLKDGFKCRNCGFNKKLEVDHIVSLDHIVRCCNFDYKSIMKDEQLFDINNGQTLCHYCHTKTPTYGRSNLNGLGSPLMIKGELDIIIRDAITGQIKTKDHYTNMFVTSGKKAIADALRGNTTDNRGEITYCAVGTSAVAPALADTGLTTEIARKQISVRTWNGDNTSTFQIFFTTSEANGTLREAGLFGDHASATLGSGILFCKAAINRTKTSNDTLTIAWTITIG